MDDILNMSGFPGDDAFRSREELINENMRLREELRQQRGENDLLTGMLAHCYEKLPQLEGADRPGLSISDDAIDLFEALPEAFTLDEALDRAERLGQASAEAARHLRAYLAERMAVQEGGRFVKTGRKPYF